MKELPMQKQLVFWIAVAAILLIGLGFIIGAAVTASSLEVTPTQEPRDGHMQTGHSHELLEYTGENPPSIQILATPDSKSGYNLEFVTQNFEWAPQASGEQHVSGQGHAHLYVNNIKIARPYGPFFHVDAQPGDLVHVTLNTNTHMAYAVDGVEVADEIVLS